MSFGVTSSGWVSKTLEQIEADIKAALRTAFGAGTPTDEKSHFGIITSIYAERIAEVWQAGADLYNAAFPLKATGAQLDDAVALAGVIRKAATKTLVTANVTFSPVPSVGVTALPAGSKASVIGVGSKFSSLTNVVSDGVTATYAVQFQADNFGPIETPAGSLSVIETPVSGWTLVTNPLDQDVLGTNTELDADLKQRFLVSLRAIGNGAALAIRAHLLELSGVTDCFVFENPSDSPDANGIPGHSIEAVVVGGADLAVAQSIYDRKPAGIGTYGTSVRHDVTGSDGLAKSIFYSRPAQQNIYMAITVTTDPKAFPSDGIARIKAAVALVTYHPGETVRAGAGSVLSAILAVPGVLEVTGLPKIGTTPSPSSSADLVFNNHQQAKLDSSRITVNGV